MIWSNHVANLWSRLRGFLSLNWPQVLLSALLLADIVESQLAHADATLVEIPSVALSLCSIVVLWRPTLGVAFGALVLPLVVITGGSRSDLDFTVIAACTLGVCRRGRSLAALYPWLFAVYATASAVKGEDTGAVLTISVAFAIAGAIGWAVSFLRVRWQRQQAEIARIETENAELREFERLRLAAELNAIVRTHAAHLSEVGAREAHSVDELREQLHELGHTSREALGELRLLVSALRMEECRVPAGSTRPAPPVDGISRAQEPVPG